MNYIYGLTDPRTNEIRYIGKTKDPHKRLIAHCSKENAGEKHKAWRKEILSLGLKPELIILQTLKDSNDWEKAEIKWIKHGKNKGWNLNNSSTGGKNGFIGVWKGRKHTVESLKKIGLASVGRKHSEKSKMRMRQLMLGRKFTPQWRRRISKAISKLSDEQVKEIRGMLEQGVSQYKIADMFGVHQGTISNINCNKFYKK